MAILRYDTFPLRLASFIMALVFAVAASVPSATLAQEGPGGVGNAAGDSGQPQNLLWLRADQYSSGTWSDISGNTNTATATDDNPSLVTNALNGQPVVSFNAGDGTTDALETSSAIGLPDSPNTVIVVAKRDDGATDIDQLLYDEGGSGGARVLAYRLNVQANVNETLASINGQNFNNAGISTSDVTTTSFNILHSNFDGSNLDLVVNGSSKTTGPGSTKSGGNGSIGDNLTGDVAEVIAYDASLNAAQVRIVLNYLQERYDLTIEEDNFGFATYNTELGGIGKTGTSVGVAGAGQHNTAQSGVLQFTVSNFTGSGDQFVFFGHDNSTLAFNGTQVNGNADTERVSRVWRADLTGQTVNRSVDVTIDRSSLPALGSGFNDYAVYVDSDGDFSSGAQFYDLSSSGTTSITINDGDHVTIARINRTISFVSDAESSFEPPTSSDPNIVPSLSGTVNFPNNESLTVDFSVTAGDNNPTSGSDFSTCCGTSTAFTLSAGQTSFDLNSRSGSPKPLEILGDNDVETNTEFVDVTLDASTSSYLTSGANSLLSYGIVDEDAGVKASFNGSDRSKSEENTGTFTVTVGLRNSVGDLSPQTTDVGYKLSGTATIDEDYERADGSSSTSGTLSFSSSSQASFDLNILNDNTFESSETIVVQLIRVDGSDPVTLAEDNGDLPTLTLTITENENQPEIQFTASSYSGTEGTNVDLTVELTATSGTDTEVDFSITDNSTETSDRTAITSSPLTIPAGQTTASITLSLDDDSQEEANETLTADLSNPVNATLGSPSSATLTIIDDDIVGSNGPGGVGDSGSLRTWLRADQGVPSAGSDVTTWQDQSGNDNDATAPSGSEPSVVGSSSFLNGRQVVNFVRNEEDYMTVDGLTDIATEDNTIFFVWHRSAGATPQGLLEVVDETDNGSKQPQARALELGFDGTVIFESTNGGTSVSGASQRDAIVSTQFVEGDGTLDLLVNRSTVGTTSGVPAQTGSAAVLGARYYDSGGNKVITLDARDHMGAEVGEIAVYERALNLAQRIIVSNALSAKFGIALSQDDLYTGDEQGYDVEVAGVGAEGPDPQDRHFNAEAGAIGLRISSFTAGEYVFAGDRPRSDDGNRLNVTDVPSGAGVTARSDFLRFLDVVGNPDFDLTFDLSEMGLRGPVGDLTNYRLLYRATSTDPWQTVAGSGGQVSGREASDDRITFTGVQFPSADFSGEITIGTTNHAASPIDTRVITVRGDAGTDNDDGYYHFAAPVATGSSAQFNDLVEPGKTTTFVNFDASTDPNPLAPEMIYTYDPTTQQYVSPEPTDALTSGEGIFMWLDDTDQGGDNDYRIDPEFTFGLPNGTAYQTDNRTVNVPYCTSNCSSEIFYMLGNPYLDAYDLSALNLDVDSNGDSEADFQQTVEVWDLDNGGVFGSYIVKTRGTTDDQISRWQGFFIERTTPGEGATTLTFDNSGTLPNLIPFIGSKAASASGVKSDRDRWARLGLELRVRDGGEIVTRDRAANLFFHEDADATWDPYDANKYEPLTDTYATLAFLGEGRSGSTRPKAQESRSTATSDNFTVDLQLNVNNVDGTFEISPNLWEYIPQDWEITLVDTKGTSDLADDTVVELTETTTYTFDVSAKSAARTASKRAPGAANTRPEMKMISKDSGVSRFQLRVNPGSALPVDLASFDAKTEDRSAVLKWTTTSETNNAGFAVEVKEENGSFREVGFVDGAGTTSETRTYRHRVENLDYGKHVFRLRQIDQDGSASYSKEVPAVVQLDQAYDVGKPYPNPFRSSATLDVTVREAQNVQVALYDVLGRRVQVLHDDQVPAQETVQIRLASGRLASGMYFLRIKGDSFSEVRRVVHVK